MVATTEPATTNDGIKSLKRKSQTKTFNPGPRQNRRGEAPSTAPALPGNESLAFGVQRQREAQSSSQWQDMVDEAGGRTVSSRWY